MAASLKDSQHASSPGASILRPVAGRSPHSNVSYISYLNSSVQ